MSVERASADSETQGAVKGYRLWRLVDGRLVSQTNGTVWPEDHALTARAYLDVGYWGISWYSAGALAVSLVLSFAVISVTLASLGAIASLGEGMVVVNAIVGVLEPPATRNTALTAGFMAFVFTIGGWISAVGPRIVPTVRAALLGQRVVEGASTPGIFAMWNPGDVQDDDAESKPGQIVVRGSAWLWGETIDHPYGVKGEYAYPDVLMDVHCVACPAWIPIGEYVDESAPPVHPQCLAGGFEVPDEWGDRQGWRASGSPPRSGLGPRATFSGQPHSGRLRAGNVEKRHTQGSNGRSGSPRRAGDWQDGRRRRTDE